MDCRLLNPDWNSTPSARPAMRKAIMTSSSVNPLAVPADGHLCRQRIVAAAPRARRDGAPAGRVDGVIRNARGRGCLPIDTISLAGGQCRRRRRLQRHYHGIRHAAGMNRQKCGEHSCSPHFRKCGPAGCDPGLGRPGSQECLRQAAYYMSSHNGSLVTTAWPASPMADGSLNTISDFWSLATPIPVVIETPVR